MVTDKIKQVKTATLINEADFGKANMDLPDRLKIDAKVGKLTTKDKNLNQ
jgi:hypothetical protein